MKNNLDKVKLTDNDKKIILKYLDICTESHGEGCNILELEERNKKIN